MSGESVIFWDDANMNDNQGNTLNAYRRLRAGKVVDSQNTTQNASGNSTEVSEHRQLGHDDYEVR